MERYWVANGILASNECGGLVKYADAQRALDAERARVKELEGAASTPINELLAELISCAGVFDVSTDYEGDRKALETATQAVLDHVATLQAQLADRDAMILQMGEQAAVLAKENMAVKAQLRQVEGERDDYRLMYMSLTGETYDNPLSRAHNELSTLRQLEGERDRLTQQLHTLQPERGAK